jgi:circadian clock protein KaiC
MSTVEVEENFTSMGLSDHTVSFLADDIVRLRYVSIDGQLRKMLLVVKLRRSEHSSDLVEYRIAPRRVILGKPFRGFRGLTTGIPGPWSVQSDDIPALGVPPVKRAPRPETRGKRKGKPRG